MKTVMKYGFPLLIAGLISAVFQDWLLTGASLLFAFAFRYFDFFDDFQRDKQTVGSKIFAYVILAMVLGTVVAGIFGHSEIFAWMFSLCLCSAWGVLIPKLAMRMWHNS